MKQSNTKFSGCIISNPKPNYNNMHHSIYETTAPQSIKEEIYKRTAKKKKISVNTNRGISKPLGTIFTIYRGSRLPTVCSNNTPTCPLMEASLGKLGIIL